MNSSGIFSYLGGSIDSFLHAFVSSVSSTISLAITPLVITGLTIWIMLFGFAVIRHEVSEPIGTFVAKAIKTSIILSFALGAGIYQSEIVAGVQALQDGFTTIVAPNASSNIYGVLDKFEAQGTTLGLVIIGHGMTLLPFGGWLDILAGLVVFVGNSVMLIICGGFLIMAKTAIAFILALGPAFIATLVFPPIAKFFDAWFAQIINYTFLIIILAFLIGLSLAITTDYISHFSELSGKSDPLTNRIADAFALVILEGSLLILLWQSPNIASSLAGGVALNGGGLGRFATNKVLSSKSGKDKDTNNSNNADGGSIEGSKKNNNAESGYVPLYRRTTIDRLGRHNK